MTLGRIAGVYIRVNLIFLLLAAVYTYLGLGLEIMVIVATVIIHEMAHALVAIMSGVKVADIELLPFGGQARIEDFTGLDPETEIYIALAGPLVSLSLAALFYFIPLWMDSTAGHLFFTLNLYLGAFNLLPALPLDGGRILRAVLSRSLGYKKATRRAAIMGQLIAIGLVAYGTYLIYINVSGVNLMVIGFFLFWAARREQKYLAYAFMRFLIHKKAELAQSGLLSSRQLVSYPDTPVKKILDKAKPSYYLLVVVMDEDHNVIGMLGEARLIEALLEKGPRACLRDC